MNEVRLTSYLTRRIGAIQERHNFNPDAGAAQIRGRPELKDAFQEFSVLRQVASVAEVEVPIPWDPQGLDPVVRPVEKPDFHVYFAKAEGQGTSGLTIWKIGRSRSPAVRISHGQTMNHLRLGVRITIGVDSWKTLLQLEDQFKYHYRKYKTRDRNNRNKCEWIQIAEERLRADIQRYREVGSAFFLEKP